MADSLREEEQRLPSIFADSFIQFLVGLALFMPCYTGRGVIYLLLLVMAMMFGAKLVPPELSVMPVKADKQGFPSEKITMTVK